MIRFACPQCTTSLAAPVEKVGAVTTCPKCRCQVRVPATGKTGIAKAPAPQPIYLGVAQPLPSEDAPGPTRRHRLAWAGLAVGLLSIVAVGGGAFLFPELNPFKQQAPATEQVAVRTTPTATESLGKQPAVETTAEPKTEPEPKTEKQPEPKTEKQPEPKTEKQPEPKAESKLEPTPQPKAKVEPKSQPLPKLEPTAEPKSDKLEDVPSLIALLTNKDAAVRLKAAKRLEKLGAAAKEAIPALTDALNDGDEDVRAVAKKALEVIKEATQRAEIAALIKQLQDKDETVRLEAAKKLGQLGAAAAEAIPALTNLAEKDADATVRQIAQRSLESIQLAVKGTLAIAELAQGLQSKKLAERLSAARALAKFGLDAKEASTALVESMLQVWPNNKEDFLDALAKINPTIHKPLVTLLFDQSTEARFNALETIEKLGSEGKAAIPALLLLWQTGLAKVQTKPSLILRYDRLSPKALIVMSVVAPQDKRVIQAVVAVIPSNPILNYSGNKTPIALAMAMKVEPKILVPALMAALNNNSAKLEAANALKSIGPDASSALAALDKLRFDPDQQVRTAAEEAMKSIRGQ